ncbi:MAG: aminopeptidase P N-terminal domain-containing protein [Longimicrobiales bacterium]
MSVYETRRHRVMERLGSDGALVVAASPELRVGLDVELRYAVDPDLFYLTGCTEPEAVLVLCPACGESPFTLFVRPRNAERELWTGVRGGPEAATHELGADAAHPIGELSERLPDMLRDVDCVYARLGGGRPEIDQLLLGVLARARRSRPRSGRGPLTLSDYGLVLNELRLRKDAHEVAAIRAAAQISVESFNDAAAVIRPGAGEWQVEGQVERGFRTRGASGPAFSTIVAAGVNATVLHYTDNACTLDDGELVLIDAGARNGMYCADITRTFPVGGRFTAEQRVLYDGVLAAHDAAIAAVRPGATIRDVHDAALEKLLATLIELGYIRGSVAELMRKERSRAAAAKRRKRTGSKRRDGRDDTEYKPYFPHQTSHWLGLDVHDVGDYVVAGEPRALEPGLVLTVEPGLYIPREATIGPPSLVGTGIRIEDDVLVTSDGHDVLTGALPLDADAVAALVQ